jgi:hypothetical protein
VDQEADGRRVGDLEERDGAEARGLAGLKDGGAQGGGRLGEDERALAQVPEGDGATGGERVPGRQQHPQLLGREGEGLDALDGGGARARHRHVDRAALDEARHLAAARVAEGHLQAGVGAVEGGERRGQPHGVRGARRDPRAPAGQARVALEVRAGAVELGQDGLGADEQVGARGRRLRAPGGAVQEPHAELLLQPAHLLGERGLRDPQLLGGAGERPVPRHGHEVLQLAELHRQSTSACITSWRSCVRRG